MNFKVMKRFLLIKSTFIEFFQEKSMRHGAALAYYAMLALIPILYLSVTFVGKFFGEEVVLELIGEMLREDVGLSDPSEILSYLDKVEFIKGELYLQIIGFFALLMSCTVIFNSLKGSINDFYGIKPVDVPKTKLVLRSIISRLISILFIFGITLFFILLYFTEPLLLSFGQTLFEGVSIVEYAFLTIAKHGVPILTNWFIFTFIFKFLTDGVVDWKMARQGALLTSVLLYFGQLFIKFYLSNFFFGAISGGVAGTILVLLVWVYYSSQIIFFGAKYIAVLSRMKGKTIFYR